MRAAQALAAASPAFTPPFVRARAPHATRPHRCTKRVHGAARRPFMASATGPTYLTAAAAARLDELLMSPRYGFELAQLMELAGQAVAHAVALAAPAPSADKPVSVAVAVGPGNNGGDGLVAARHLKLLRPAWRVGAVAPKTRFAGLVTSATASGVRFADSVDDLVSPDGSTVLVDALFGFSFDGASGVRAPFDALLRQLDDAAAARDALLVAVDVPSGWHVEHGRVYDAATRAPDVLVSLSAPKLVAQTLPNRSDGSPVPHYVGGRFVPHALAAELGIVLPRYSGLELVTRVA